MATHRLSPTPETLHGYFSRDRKPVLEIEPGDTVIFETPDAGWGMDGTDPFAPAVKFDRPTPQDDGHALIGPIFVRGARPGMTLEVQIMKIVTGNRGWCSAGGYPMWTSEQLALVDVEEATLRFALDPDSGWATDQQGRQLEMRPFMGVLGMPTDEPGFLPTRPPRRTGGNIDCKELRPGATLWLPIEMEGALFSTGDGHAMQGDGEVAGPAMECPMKHVELEFHLRDSHLSLPRAMTAAGMVTLGFDQDLNKATVAALGNMVDWLVEKYGVSKQEAVALFSLVGDLRITQVVNIVKGVHAVVDPARLSRYFEGG